MGGQVTKEGGGLEPATNSDGVMAPVRTLRGPGGAGWGVGRKPNGWDVLIGSIVVSGDGAALLGQRRNAGENALFCR